MNADLFLTEVHFYLRNLRNLRIKFKRRIHSFARR
jgi:hypothetical protein